jgi:hypothetical protein
MVLFYREPDGFLNPQFWAEDGVIFFIQDLTFGFAAIWKPYAGYLHFIPRIITYLSGFFPLSWLPVLYNFSFVTIILFVISYLFSPRIYLPFKPLLAISIVLIPYNGEIMMSITNLQWFLAIFLILFVIQEKPQTNYQLLLDTVFIITIGLTGPFIILFWPLFIVRILYFCRSYYSGYILLLTLLLVLIQSYFIWSGGKLMSSSNASYNLQALEQVLALRFSGVLLFGKEISLALNIHLLAGLTVILTLGLFLLANSEPLPQRIPILVFLLSGIITIIACFYKFRHNLGILIPFDNGARYFYLFHLLTVWSIIIYLHSSKKIIRLLASALLLMVLLAKLTHFQVTPLINYHWKQYINQIESGKNIKIPINPSGWFLSIPNK